MQALWVKVSAMASLINMEANTFWPIEHRPLISIFALFYFSIMILYR